MNALTTSNVIVNNANCSINVKSYFKRQPNLMNYLVNNIRFPFISKCYNKCIDISCKICKSSL
jgi:hypothetical protein